MSSTEQSLAVARRYATAWADDDLEGILGCYAVDFTLHYFGDNPFTGDHVGRDTAFGVLLEVGRRAPRRLIAVDEVLAGPDAAALVVREEIQVGDETIEIRRTLRFRIAGDQLTECWLYDEDQALIDRAWSNAGVEAS